MSDTAQLQALGQQLAAALVTSYGSTTPSAKLVFLPGGVSVPHDIVQSGMVNPAQMMTWLSINFDAPFVVSPGEASVLGKDPSHGSATQIYTMAISNARPLGTPGDDVWTRVDHQIAAAQRSLGPTDAPKSVVCSPDDWPLPTANAGYWTKFESMDVHKPPAPSDGPVPLVNPQFWMVRSLAAEAKPPSQKSLIDNIWRHDPGPASHTASAVTDAVNPAPAMGDKAASTQAAKPSILDVIAKGATGLGALLQSGPQLQAWRAAADGGSLPQTLISQLLFKTATPVENLETTTASTISIHLEHQCVNLGYYSAGQPWWDGVFLADPGWYLSGMPLGGLLPPAGGADDAAFGLPVALIIVQNLRVSGQWSPEAAAALGSEGGTVGPLSLFGAVPSTGTDGVTVTFAHEGMQVVALLCSPLPVLPPSDPPPPPGTDTGPASADTSPAGDPTVAPTDSGGAPAADPSPPGPTADPAGSSPSPTG